MIERQKDIFGAWRSLTRSEPPDDLMDYVRDVDSVVKYLNGNRPDAALNSTQVMALAIVLRWREQSRAVASP